MSVLFSSLSGVPILKGTFVLPFSGIWHADLELVSVPIVDTTPLILTFADMTLTCTAIRTVDFTGRREVRVVGGMGGWRKTLTAKQYMKPFLSTVVLDAALSVGELVALGIDEFLDAFIRRQAPAATILQELFGDTWWMNDLGIVQTMARIGVPITSQFTVTEVYGRGGLYHVETDAPGDWRPGNLFFGPTASGSVNRVTHLLNGTNLRTEVLVA